MGIHTILVSLRLTNQQFYTIRNCIYEYAKGKGIRIIRDDDNFSESEYGKYQRKAYRREVTSGEKLTMPLYSDGIDITLTKISLHEYRVYKISYKINLATAAGYEYITLFTPDMLKFVVDNTNKKLQEISDLLPCFDDCKLKRVDFTYNISLGSPNLVSQYIHLAKMGVLPAGFEFEPVYNPKTKETWFPKNSVTFSRGDTSIVLYDKYSQMKSKETWFNSEDIKSAYGILRMEIQTKNNKVNYIMDKHKFKSIRNFLNCSEELARQEFEYYFPHMFCRGDYYSQEQAKEKIISSSYKPKAKGKMLEFMRYVNSVQSLNQGLIFLRENKLSTGQILYLLKKFDSLDLNPCVIPNEWNINYLKNPIKLLPSDGKDNE